MSALEVKRLSDAHKAAISASMKKLFASGCIQPPDWRMGVAARTPEGKARGVAKVTKKLTGKPRSLGTKMGKHTNNAFAKLWSFKNTGLGAKLVGKNLNQLLRDNPHLFLPKHLNWKKGTCAAGTALRALTKNNPLHTRNSWFGWTLD